MNGENYLPDVVYIGSGGEPNPRPEPILAQLVPPSQQTPRPATRGRRWRTPLFLFLATCLSTIYVGGISYSPVVGVTYVLSSGLMYGAAVMTILACHEAGHFIQTRRYRVPATLPFFLPLPLPPIGTLGAVIAMDSRISDRRALFDIGITGPLAGLIPTLICCLVGLQLSGLEPYGRGLGFPPIFQAMAWMTVGPIPQGLALDLHPIAMAGWVGLLITALNLMPIGQLDGGHILYGLLRSRAHVVASLMLMLGMAAVLVFGLWGWSLMMCLLILMGPKHPPTANDNTPLGPVRIAMGWLTLAFVPLGFTPIPFS